MRPSLHSSFDLLLRHRRAYLYRREDNQPVLGLSPLEAVTMGLMDGERSSDEIAEFLGGAGRPDATPLVAGLVERLGPLLVDGIPRRSSHELELLASVLPVDPNAGLRRLPGPQILHWWVTSYCPKRCVYCFANPTLGNQAKDAVITRAQLGKVFVEAASLGALRLLVAGAEPLLRPDLPEVIGDAVAAGLLPLMTTKHRIDCALAERFAAAGLRHISLSLDTLDPVESRKLIGLANYPEHVRDSIASLKHAGGEFSLQTVLTRFNPDALRSIVQFASEQGARVVQIVPYEPVRAPIGPFDNEALTAVGTRDAIKREIDRLAGTIDGVKIELFEELGSGSRNAYQCDIGMTKLFFLPDGVIHRCYKLTDDDRLRGRDLRTTSVAAAWHDPTFRLLISPPQVNYTGTACGSCQRFSSCHNDGRCIYQSLVDHGRYEAPDRDCGGPHLVPLSVL